MQKVVFDGWLIRQGKRGDSFSGSSRYAIEILLELDKIVKPGKYELLIRSEYENLIRLKNIKKIVISCKSRFSWRLQAFFYLAKKHAWYVHFENGLALRRKSIITLHDIYAFYGVTEVNTARSKARIILSTLIAKRIVTVSEYSKQTMVEKLPVKPEKIKVIENGWQHIKKVQSDDKILERCGLRNGQYYFFIGRLVKNKNIKWIFEVADRNPHSLFAISGALWNEPFSYYRGKHGNIIYTGFVTDSEMKSLYQHCKAFLFPSIMEGFGIPPMEALYNGAPIIIANTSCLPEVYGKSAHYIDPYKYDYDLDEVLKEPVEPVDSVLDKYSWEKSARKWKELIESYAR